jgi:hypothetical protein
MTRRNQIFLSHRMNFRIAFILLLFVSVNLFPNLALAQSEFESTMEVQESHEIKTLFGHNRRPGFYGGFSSGFSPIDDRPGATFSARGTWLIDRGFGLGFGGTGLINNVDQVMNWPDMHYSANNKTLTGGYGGIVIEPILFPRMPVHLSFPVLLGAGAVSTFDNLFYSYYSLDGLFLVAEPHVELELNMTRFARFAVYGSYRFTTKLQIEGVSENALSNYSVGCILKLGLFR